MDKLNTSFQKILVPLVLVTLILRHGPFLRPGNLDGVSILYIRIHEDVESVEFSLNQGNLGVPNVTFPRTNGAPSLKRYIL